MLATRTETLAAAIVMVVGPPLALLLLAAIALAWVSIGARSRSERQAELAAALQRSDAPYPASERSPQ